MIQSLTEFTVTPEYHRSRTVYHVRDKGGAKVAELRKDGLYDSPGPAEVFTGPGLDQPAGWVTAVTAMGPNRVKVGQVDLHKAALGKNKWRFAQEGLPELPGQRAGAVGSLRETWPAREVLNGGLADGALSMHLRFRAPGCDGFELSRPPGLKARYKVRVHDERVSRLLVLSMVVSYSTFVDVDPRKDIADVTSNPFKA